MSKKSSFPDNSSKRRRSSARDGKRRCPSAHAKVCSAHKLLNEALPYACPISNACQCAVLCSSCKKILKNKRSSQIPDTVYCRKTQENGSKKSIKNRLFCNEPTCPYSKCCPDELKQCTDIKKKKGKSKEMPGEKVNLNGGALGTEPKQRNSKQTPTIAKRSIQKKRAFNAESLENIQMTSEVNNMEQSFVKVKSQLLITQSNIISQEAKEPIGGDDTAIASSLFESFALENKQLDAAVDDTPIAIVNLMPQNEINAGKCISKDTRIENISEDINCENTSKDIHNSSTTPECIKPKDSDEHEPYFPIRTCELSVGDPATSVKVDPQSISKEPIAGEASGGQFTFITKQLDKEEQTSICSTCVKAYQQRILRDQISKEASGGQLNCITKQLDKGEQTSNCSTNVKADQQSISKEQISEEATGGQLVPITKLDKGEQTSICFNIVKADQQSISKEQISRGAAGGQLTSITKQLDTEEQTLICSTSGKADPQSISEEQISGEAFLGDPASSVKANQQSISKEQISEEASGGQLNSTTRQLDKGEQTSICFTIVKADQESISKEQISEGASLGDPATTVKVNQQSISKEQISEGASCGQLVSTTKQLDKGEQTSICFTIVKADQESISEEASSGQLTSMTKQLDKGEQTSICLTSVTAVQQSISKEQISREAAGGKLTFITKHLDKGEQTSICSNELAPVNGIDTKNEISSNRINQLMSFTNEHCICCYDTKNELVDTSSQTPSAGLASENSLKPQSIEKPDSAACTDKHEKLNQNLNNRDAILSYAKDCCCESTSWNSYQFIAGNIVSNINNPDCASIPDNESDVVKGSLITNIANQIQSPVDDKDKHLPSTSKTSNLKTSVETTEEVTPNLKKGAVNGPNITENGLENSKYASSSSSYVKRSVHEIEAALQNLNRPIKESIHKKKDIGKTDTDLGRMSSGEVERTSNFDSSKDRQESLANTPDKQNSKEASNRPKPLALNTSKDENTAVKDKDIGNGLTEPIDLTNRHSTSASKPSDAKQLMEKKKDREESLANTPDKQNSKEASNRPKPLALNTSKDENTAIKDKDIGNGLTEPIDLTNRRSTSASKPSDAKQLIEKNKGESQKDRQGILDSTSDKNKTTAPKISKDEQSTPKSADTRQSTTDSMSIKQSSVNKNSILKNDPLKSDQNKKLENKNNTSSVFLDDQSSKGTRVGNQSSTSSRTSAARQSIDKNKGINQNITNKNGETLMQSETKRQTTTGTPESTTVKRSSTETPANPIATTSKSSDGKRSTETARQSLTTTKTLPSKDQQDSNESPAAKRSSTNESVKRLSTPLKTLEIRSSTDRNEPTSNSLTNAEAALKTGQQLQTKVHPVKRSLRAESNKSVPSKSATTTGSIDVNVNSPQYLENGPIASIKQNVNQRIDCDNRPVLPFCCPYCSLEHGLDQNQMKGKKTTAQQACCPYCGQNYSIKKTELVHGGSGQPSSTKCNKSPITLHVADSDMFFDASDSDFGLVRSQYGPSSASTLPFAASETQSGYSKYAKPIGTRCSEVKNFDEISLKSAAKCCSDSKDHFFDAVPFSDKKQWQHKVDSKYLQSTVKSHCPEKVENTFDLKSSQPLNRINECRCSVKKTTSSLPDFRQHRDKENFYDIEDHKKVKASLIKKQDDQKCNEIQTNEQKPKPCAKLNSNKTEPEPNAIRGKYSTENTTNCSKCLGALDMNLLELSNAERLNFTTVYHCNTSTGMAEVSIRFPITEHSLDCSANPSVAIANELCDLNVIRNLLQNVQSMQCNKKGAIEEETNAGKDKEKDGHSDKENSEINKSGILCCCSKKSSEQKINNMKTSSNSQYSICILGKILSSNEKLKMFGEDEISKCKDASLSTMQSTKSVDADCKRDDLESKSFYTDALSMRSFYDVQSSKSMEFESKMNFKDVKSEASLAWVRPNL